MDSTGEIFEISDFTCVTEWERFTADIESVIHEWQLTNNQNYRPLNKGALSAADWKIREENFKYGPIEFNITHYCAEIPESFHKIDEKTTSKSSSQNNDYFPKTLRDLLDISQEFSTFNSEIHSLVHYYGIREFVVLMPSNRNKELLHENIQNIVLSSLIIATNNTQCEVPMFVQLGERWRQIFAGVCQNSDVRTHFDMVHLKHRPSKCGHLTALLDLFKEKMATPIAPAPPVKVSVRVTYKLQEAFDQQWTRAPEDFHAENVEELRNLLRKKNFSQLPFGAVQDPLQDLILAVAWHGLNEDMLVENDVYSDLDPLSAPHWSVSVGFTPKFQCLMSEYLKEYMKLTGCHKTVEKVLGYSVGIADMSVPLERLAKRTSPDFKLMVAKNTLNSSNSSSAIDKLPLKEEALNDLLVYLFPDSVETSPTERKFSTDSSNSNTSDVFPLLKPSSGKVPQLGGAVKIQRRRSSSVDHKHVHRVQDELDSAVESALAQSKIAPKNSLPVRLALVLCHLANSMQIETALCQIWREFLLELRYRLENGIRLPGLENVTPNLSTCFLNQKIQMLNCCIERKISRELKSTTGDSLGENDEFFDCVDDVSEINPQSTGLSDGGKAEGRLKLFDGKTRLISKQEDLMYIPLTQDPAPLTEDTIEERTHSLIELGTSEEAAAIRAKIQCSSLVSDMEAFKAANPGCCFEDFLKWYSPKDLVEKREVDGSVSYTLSPRMASTDNLWSEAWSSSKAVPVSRQKRLFDDTKEAEKILHWLGSLKVSEIIRLTLPPLFAMSLTQLWEEARPVRRLIDQKLLQITEQFPNVIKNTNFIEYDDLRKSFEWVEATVSQYRTLKNRFSSVSGDLQAPNGDELDLFIVNLMKQPDVKLLGGSRDYLGQILTKLFHADTRISDDEPSQNNKFPIWLSKEYVFRSIVPRPFASSRESVQRLYVFIKDKEFRCAGAFTEDVLFFTP